MNVAMKDRVQQRLSWAADLHDCEVASLKDLFGLPGHDGEWLRKELALAAARHVERGSRLLGEVVYPDVEVKLVGEDGNAFAILARVIKALRKGGADSQMIDRFQREARAGDYDHLLATVMQWVVAT